MNRLSRWIRGDWQITKWLSPKKPLNLLSKYKILDNLRRSLMEIAIIVAIVYCNIVGILETKKIWLYSTIFLGVAILPYLLEMINSFIFKKEGEEKQKTFTPKISGIKGSFLRAFLTLWLFTLQSICFR